MAHPRDMRIDYLRVIAVSAILLHHSDDYGSPFLRATPSMSTLDDMLLGYLPLASLFLISGFLAAQTQRTQARSPRAYVMRRFLRVYLPYAVALVLLKALGIFVLDWPTVVVNLLLLGPWAGDAIGTLWFVEVLLCYQVVHIAWQSNRVMSAKMWTLSVWIVVLVCAGALVARVLGFDADPRLLIYAPVFTVGVVIGELQGGSHRRLEALLPAVAAFGIGSAAYLLPVWSEVIPLNVTTTITASIAVGSYLLVSNRQESREGGRGSALVTRLAHGSMMAYLSHRFVFEWLSRITEPAGVAVTDITLVAAIPLVLVMGVPLQRAYDAATARMRTPMRG